MTDTAKVRELAGEFIRRVAATNTLLARELEVWLVGAILALEHDDAERVKLRQMLERVCGDYYLLCCQQITHEQFDKTMQEAIAAYRQTGHSPLTNKDVPLQEGNVF